jgi:hypothetical protein
MLKLVVNNDNKEDPRVLDTDLAGKLGIKRAYQIRELIGRNLDELRTYGDLSCDTINSGKPGRPAKAYHLNEAQALLVCSFARTPPAAKVRKLLIDTFQAYRDGHLALTEKGKVALPNFEDAAEAARAWADVWEQSKKATAAVKTHLSHLTINEFFALNHLYAHRSTKNRLSMRAKKLCLNRGISIDKQHRVTVEGFKVSLNVYPLRELQEAAAAMGIQATHLDLEKAA